MHPAREKNIARDSQIVAAFKGGATMEQVGQQHGITRERVRVILKRSGVAATDGGCALRQRARAEAVRESRDAKAIRIWGVPHARMLELRSAGVLRAFQQQRINAEARGIPFLLTFPQWLAIWEQSGRLEQRGRGRGGFVMSRIGDRGGYEVGNVHIQSAVENSREASAQWIGKKKAAVGVFNLYPGRPRPWKAQANGVTLGYFATQAEAVAARSAAKA